MVDRSFDPRATSPIQGVPASNAVTYDYPENSQGNEPLSSTRAYESPFKYNSDIAALKTAMQPLFDIVGNPVNNQLGNYNKSTAPKDTWLNYWQVVLNTNVVAPGVGLLWGYLYDAVQFNPQVGLDSGTIAQMTGVWPQWNNPVGPEWTVLAFLNRRPLTCPITTSGQRQMFAVTRRLLTV